MDGQTPVEDWAESLRVLLPEQDEEVLGIAQARLPIPPERATRLCSRLSDDSTAALFEDLVDDPECFVSVVDERALPSENTFDLIDLIPLLFEKGEKHPQLYSALSQLLNQLNDDAFKQYAVGDLKTIITTDALHRDVGRSAKKEAGRAVYRRVGEAYAEFERERIERFMPDDFIRTTPPEFATVFVRPLPTDVQFDLISEALRDVQQRPTFNEQLLGLMDEQGKIEQLFRHLAGDKTSSLVRAYGFLLDYMDNPRSLHDTAVELFNEGRTKDYSKRNALLPFLREWPDEWGDINDAGLRFTIGRKPETIYAFDRLGGQVDGAILCDIAGGIETNDPDGFAEALLDVGEFEQEDLDRALREHVQALINRTDPAYRDKTLGVLYTLIGHGARPNPPNDPSLFVHTLKALKEADDRVMAGRVLKVLLELNAGPNPDEQKAVYEHFLKGRRPTNQNEILRAVTSPQFHPTRQQLERFEGQVSSGMHEAILDNLNRRQRQFAEQ